MSVFDPRAHRPPVQDFGPQSQVNSGITDQDVASFKLTQPPAPEGWRRTGPTQATGTGISWYYAMELAELAKDLPGFRDGCEVRADYRCVDGEWFPISESVRIVQ